jgi:hypothetical protein
LGKMVVAAVSAHCSISSCVRLRSSYPREHQTRHPKLRLKIYFDSEYTFALCAVYVRVICNFAKFEVYAGALARKGTEGLSSLGSPRTRIYNYSRVTIYIVYKLCRLIRQDAVDLSYRCMSTSVWLRKCAKFARLSRLIIVPSLIAALTTI